MDGTFINGWMYTDGKITGRISESNDNSNLKLRSMYCDLYCWYETVQHCYDDVTPDFDEEYGMGATVTRHCTTASYERCGTICEYRDDSGSGSDYGGGGGGGSDNSSTPPPPGPATQSDRLTRDNNLDETGKKVLDETLQEMLWECGYNALYNYLKIHGHKLDDIRMNPSLSTPGGYYPGSNVMEFQSHIAISQNFPEEFIHFFQNSYYFGGTSQYTTTGKSNIEYEAKLIQDIVCYVGTGGCQQLALNQKCKYVKEYYERLKAITIGGTRIPSYNDLLVKDPLWNNLNYWDFMEDYCAGVPDYNYPVNKNLIPQALNYIYNNGYCN